jgi:hypothetical protein
MKLFPYLFRLLAGLVISPVCMLAEVKETHKIIGEWVATERLISEEETEWELEKSSLLDLKQALGAEISELNTKLDQTEEEAVGAAKQRTDLLSRMDAAKQATQSLHQGWIEW